MPTIIVLRNYQILFRPQIGTVGYTFYIIIFKFESTQCEQLCILHPFKIESSSYDAGIRGKSDQTNSTLKRGRWRQCGSAPSEKYHTN